MLIGPWRSYSWLTIEVCATSASMMLGTPCNCQQSIIDALVAQTSMVKQEYDLKGRIKIVDPDDQDELAVVAGTLEGHKSPDHFHSMILNWWVAGGAARIQLPVGMALNGDGIRRIGERMGGGVALGGQAARVAVGVVGGQAAWVRRRYS